MENGHHHHQAHAGTHDPAKAVHAHHPATHHEGEEGQAAAMAELLDLDAEVLQAYLTELTGWIHGLASDPSPRRILDLGSGTGTGTVALAREFPDAEITALDASESMLQHLAGKARDLGLADRIHPVQADLDKSWPAVEPFGLVWASSSMHHMADPDRVLADIYGAVSPGGRLVVVEMDSFPRFLPDDLGIGRPGLEARCRAVLSEELAAHLPSMGSDWGPRLGKAGFTIEEERQFAIDLQPPLPAATGRYAATSLGRMRDGVESRLSADDRATLDALLDPDGPHSILRRDDLTVRTVRSVWVGKA